MSHFELCGLESTKHGNKIAWSRRRTLHWKSFWLEIKKFPRKNEARKNLCFNSNSQHFLLFLLFFYSSFPCEDGSLLICDVLGETSVYNKKRPRV